MDLYVWREHILMRMCSYGLICMLLWTYMYGPHVHDFITIFIYIWATNLV
jgi:hypothetical protein